jgi:hypothetical protein
MKSLEQYLKISIFSCGTGFWTQDLVLTRQALYHLIHLPSPSKQVFLSPLRDKDLKQKKTNNFFSETAGENSENINNM